jgi:hypothetical protein
MPALQQMPEKERLLLRAFRRASDPLGKGRALIMPDRNQES